MIEKNFQKIIKEVNDAETSSVYGQKVTLVAVSKTHPASDILKVYNEGQRDFGENKPQELAMKYELLPKDIRWHMIGHLQTNKVKYIIDKVCMIHSVDSLRLAEAINKEAVKHGITMPVLIEVNIGREESKSGIDPEGLEELLYSISGMANIQVCGLMCIPPVSEEEEDSRKYFAALRNLSIDIKDRNIDNIQMNVLSMGMSSDFKTAISEGSTIVRVGTSIFGMRYYSNL